MVTFFVNDQQYEVEGDGKLLPFLRDICKCKSVKDGCSEGACGTCHVLIDGKATKAFIPTLSKMDGKHILTVEGLSEEEKDMVSYEPSELSETLKTRSSLIDTEDALGQEGNSTSIMSRAASLLPTSGYEPKYNPKYWNKDSNIRRANCYAYAMDVLKRTEGK